MTKTCGCNGQGPSLKNPKTTRLNWDETFMNLALLIAKRAACRYHEVGAVFVDANNRIISLGYNGPTAGDAHCIDKNVGCAKVDGDPITGELKKCRGAHAEMNGIINSQDTTRLRGAKLYSTNSPCYSCMKALNNAGIKKIIYFIDYKRIKPGGGGAEEEKEAKELAEKRGIELVKYSGKVYCDIFGS